MILVCVHVLFKVKIKVPVILVSLNKGKTQHFTGDVSEKPNVALKRKRSIVFLNYSYCYCCLFFILSVYFTRKVNVV